MLLQAQEPCINCPRSVQNKAKLIFARKAKLHHATDIASILESGGKCLQGGSAARVSIYSLLGTSTGSALGLLKSCESKGAEFNKEALCSSV
jgi:hypothetical protein